MISPRASRKSRRTPRRGRSGSPTRPAANPSSPRPETRMTPMPLRPGAVAIAAMMSSSFIELVARAQAAAARATLALAGGRRLALKDARDAPLLRDREHVVDEPVENQSRREEEEHAEHDRHDLHDLGLHRIRRLGVEQGLYPHGRGHQDRKKTNWHSEPH